MKNRILFACVCAFLFIKTQSGFCGRICAFAFVGYIITRFGKPATVPQKSAERRIVEVRILNIFIVLPYLMRLIRRNDLDYECYSTDAANHLQAQICNRLRFVS